MDHAVTLDATNATDENINYLCKDAGKVLFKGDKPKLLLSGAYSRLVKCTLPVPQSSSGPLSAVQCYARAKTGLWLCSIGINHFQLVVFFCVLFLEKPFSVGLVDQLFQPASNQVETFDKAFA